MIPDTSIPFPRASEFSDFGRDGFQVFDLLNSDEASHLENFVQRWLTNVFEANGYTIGGSFDSYHRWPNLSQIDHGALFKATNRHCTPSTEIKDLIFSPRMNRFLASIGFGDYDLWDEGLGWLAYRFIRPKSNDGYPLSIKAWGPAKNVLSLYIPVWGLAADDSIGLVPRSHLKDYPHYLPQNTQHRKDEYRLDESVKVDIFRPQFKKGQILVFHPRLLHTEKTSSQDMTRVSLEVRILPKAAGPWQN